MTGTGSTEGRKGVRFAHKSILDGVSLPTPYPASVFNKVSNKGEGLQKMGNEARHFGFHSANRKNRLASIRNTAARRSNFALQPLKQRAG